MSVSSTDTAPAAEFTALSVNAIRAPRTATDLPGELYKLDVLTEAEFAESKADLLAQLKSATTDEQLALV